MRVESNNNKNGKQNKKGAYSRVMSFCFVWVCDIIIRSIFPVQPNWEVTRAHGLSSSLSLMVAFKIYDKNQWRN